MLAHQGVDFIIIVAMICLVGGFLYLLIDIGYRVFIVLRNCLKRRRKRR